MRSDVSVQHLAGDPIVLRSDSPQGRFAVVFEDDGNTGYLYGLDSHLPPDEPIVDALHVYNVGSMAGNPGTAPQPASSGQTIRHRLSRSGDRQANNAIHTIAMSRSINHAESRAYLERRISQGKTHKEAMRSLKRHVSRRLYHRLVDTPLTP